MEEIDKKREVFHLSTSFCRVFRHHNCVFVGYEHGKPAYGALRGTLSDSTFAGEVPGSDKRFSFAVPLCAGGKTLCVFEAAIDALSYLTLLKLHGQDWRTANTLSLSGIYQLSEYEVINNPPRSGKDYNDQLQMVKGISGRVRTRGGEAR